MSAPQSWEPLEVRSLESGSLTNSGVQGMSMSQRVPEPEVAAPTEARHRGSHKLASSSCVGTT
eukprot:CAMPEP_0174700146 /NCGR_PEP_ID=MMETSP1094-20130205/5190_1 /TAXON_ID=156173 /ORGANISM="Chrysochromulina brevifilum, Strain UTEX LB 985" /LENGTH=62 /DNA_ID=CAMNT_0015897581 /DNA_START=183 /DNA_END=367 /DNA_ORIENTATION=+